jgi:hypothetical protein
MVKVAKTVGGYTASRQSSTEVRRFDEPSVRTVEGQNRWGLGRNIRLEVAELYGLQERVCPNEAKVRDHESMPRSGNGIGMLKNLPRKRLVLLTLLMTLIAVGLVGWFGIGYPGKTGYTSYDTDLPGDFDLSDAEQALVGQGYSVEVDHTPEYYEYPYLRTRSPQRDSGVTTVSIYVNEQGNLIEVSAWREVYVTPYEVVQDLSELARENQRVAEEDMRDVLDVVGLPSTGLFTFTDEVDSFDFMLPSLAFYFLLFVHLPAVILLTVATIIWKDKESASLPSTDSPVERGQY